MWSFCADSSVLFGVYVYIFLEKQTCDRGFAVTSCILSMGSDGGPEMGPLMLDVSISLFFVSWEPEGRYCSSKMFRWEQEGLYRCTKSIAITPFWFSTEHCWSAITPFWLSTDDLSSSTNLLTSTKKLVWPTNKLITSLLDVIHVHVRWKILTIEY